MVNLSGTGSEPTRSASVIIDRVRAEYPATTAGGESLVAIADITLSIAAGEFVSIIGPSGCGKSSLLYLINGINAPASGSIVVGGESVSKPSAERALVFQDASLLPWNSVLANVAMGLQVQGVPKAEREAQAGALLKLVGLEAFGAKLPHQLSGGMKQRVNIARALCVDPEVLLMDEPFGALDAQTRQLMGAELLRIWHDRKKTILFVTHDLDEAIYLADRVVVMSARPARVLDEVRVNLPRPRLLDIENSAAFREIREHVWKLLESEVTAAWRASGAL
jgi:ABC-type nitrate/sulfonate/bicarbonate transport system ATPase subunit